MSAMPGVVDAPLILQRRGADAAEIGCEIVE
jgi:hypothetical protein